MRRSRSLLLSTLLCVVSSATLVGQEASHSDAVVLPVFERFFSSVDTDPLAAGAYLVGELGCTNCHLPSTALAERIVSKVGPTLDGVGDRLRVDFLLEYLTDPHGVKPGTTMPDLLAAFGRSERREMTRSITHFLASLKGSSTSTAERQASMSNGRRLYHRVGCVACHAPEDGYRPSSLPEGVELQELKVSPVPLGDVAEKYTVRGLAAFLRDPLAVRPSGRMPSLRLTDGEALDISSYLLKRSHDRPDNFTIDRELAGKGRAHFAQLGCASCHQVTFEDEPVRPTRRAHRFSDLTSGLERGCLAVTPAVGVPRYELSKLQRVGLRAVVRQPDNRSPIVAANRTRRVMFALNCFACHARRAEAGPEDARRQYFESDGKDLGDEGRFPPHLTGVGAKLVPQALRSIIRGEGGVRPYVATRMPDFGPRYAAELTSLFQKADLPDEVLHIERVGRNRFGRRLVGVDGLSCITCHDFGDRPSLGIRAVDLVSMGKRLRPEWFRFYLEDPASFYPRTRMPSFWPGGEAVLKTVRGGNTDTQIDDIWVYLMEADQTRLPNGMEAANVFELVPRERPIVFRTFMKGAGAHAIAVGYVGGPHFAFDALAGRVDSAWKGRFLDAESTWENRFTPPALPLGAEILGFPKGPLIAPLQTASAPWPDVIAPDALLRFRGYRLDVDGVPTLLYGLHGVLVEERLTPIGGGVGLERRITLRGDRSGLWMRLWRGDDAKCRVLEPADAVVRSDDGEIRMPIAGISTVRLEIRW